MVSPGWVALYWTPGWALLLASDTQRDKREGPGEVTLYTLNINITNTNNTNNITITNNTKNTTNITNTSYISILEEFRFAFFLSVIFLMSLNLSFKYFMFSNIRING